MAGPKGERCADCYWWEHITEFDGYCHGSTPGYYLVKKNEANLAYEWGKTQADGFCPAFKAIDMELPE